MLMLVVAAGALLLAVPTEQEHPLRNSSAGAAAKAVPSAPWSVVYHDGSANGYRFWRDAKSRSALFEYTPVRKEESSSGVYSGGKPAKGRVDAKRVAELWQRVRKLEADTAHHATAREMGTGAFKVSASSREREFLVKSGPALREFDMFAITFRGSKYEER
jgi:hypothetical protein